MISRSAIKSHNCSWLWKSYTSATCPKPEIWQPTIGLEIHAQINTKSKLFSRAENAFAGVINDQVAFHDAALPGTLPVLNRECVKAGLLTALALNSNINLVSYFDRKHYFYADLPAGYQITQQRRPLARGGSLDYLVTGQKKQAKIWQLQLEQDSGKSLHDPELAHSLIDLNRAGVGLMEIVTAPDFKTGEEAAAFVKELHLLLLTLGTCNGKMAEGALRVDASISLHQPGQPLGVRTEVKNLNSIRFVKKAIDYEIKRQLGMLTRGEDVENETRSFDPNTGQTLLMRDKEKLHDYRFMPEPNLLPLRLHDDSSPAPPGVISVSEVRQSMPLLPGAKRQRLVDKYGVSQQDAARIVNEVGMWEVVEELCSDSHRSPRVLVNFLLKQVLEELNSRLITLRDSCLTPQQLADLVHLLEAPSISIFTAHQLLKECLSQSGLGVRQEVETRHLQLISPEELSAVCDAVISNHPQLVKKYQQSFKKRHLVALTKWVVSAANEKVDTATARHIVIEKLGGQDQQPH